MSQVASHLLFVLAAIVALGPLSVDLYLPAMPSMVSYFGTDLTQVQMTLSSYLLGFAVFHLVCGPLSDRFGRKPVLLGGLALYVVMSVFCAMASSIEELILYRFFQAMGACCAPTLGRAIVRDIYPPDQAVKALAYVSSLMALAPVVAPSIGGVLVTLGDWRLAFWALVVVGLVAMALTLFLVPESLPQRQTLHPLNILRNFKVLVTNSYYMGNVLTASFLYSAMFAFLSGSSFVLIDFMHVEPQHFGFYFLFIVTGYITGNLFTAKIAYRWPPRRLYITSLWIAFVPAVAMVWFNYQQWYHPILVVFPVLFSSLSVGLALPQTMAEALKPFPHMAATASAMMGFLQMTTASVAGWLVGLFLVDEPTPMALVILGSAISAAICYQLLLRKRLQQTSK